MSEINIRPGATTPEPPPAPGSKFKVLSQGATDVGRKRDHNEDSYLIDEELGLYVVCDGMGGHAGGGTASRIAVETIDKTLRAARDSAQNPFSRVGSLTENHDPDAVREAVEQACMGFF